MSIVVIVMTHELTGEDCKSLVSDDSKELSVNEMVRHFSKCFENSEIELYRDRVEEETLKFARGLKRYPVCCKDVPIVFRGEFVGVGESLLSIVKRLTQKPAKNGIKLGSEDIVGLKLSEEFGI